MDRRDGRDGPNGTKGTEGTERTKGLRLDGAKLKPGCLP
jgi:hypothetical protein